MLATALVMFPPSPAASAAPYQRCLEAGAASVTLGIPAGTPLAGYGSAARRLLFPDLLDRYPHAFWFRPHAGRLDDLAARALVLERDGVRVIWIAADLIAVDRGFTEDFARRLSEGDGRPSTVIVSASHTHSGPGAFIDSRLMAAIAVDRMDHDVREKILDGMVEAARRAERTKRPARLGAASVNGPPVTTGRLGVPLDNEMVIMKITSLAGAPIALVWNYAIHGTMLGPRNLAISGDVMGVASRELERELGVPALFVNGAVGDVSPREHGHAAAVSVGRELAATARAAWGRLVTLEETPLTVRTRQVELPPPALSIRNCTGRAVPRALTVPLDSALRRSATLTAVGVGGTAWVTVPGELQSRLGVEIKRAGRPHWRYPFVAGLSNDYLGYFVGAAEFERPSYVTCASVFGPRAGEQLSGAAAELLRELGSSQR